MGTTTKGFWFPDGSDDISPLHPVLGAMQTSVDNGLNNPRFDTPAGIHRVTDAAGLTTLVSDLLAAGYTVSSSNPAYAFRADTQLLYENTGSGWHLYRNIPWFANLTALNAAIPSPDAGTLAVIGQGTALAEYIWSGTAWTVIYQQPQNYTPTITASSGAFTTVSGACRWSRVGRLITATYNVVITTAGTAAGNVRATLPVVALGGIPEHGIGREIASTGVALIAWRVNTTQCDVAGYDNVSRIASGRTYRWTITYEAAV